MTLRLVLYLVSLNREKLKDLCPFNDILFSKVIRKDVEEAAAGSSIKNKNILLHFVLALQHSAIVIFVKLKTQKAFHYFPCLFFFKKKPQHNSLTVLDCFIVRLVIKDIISDSLYYRLRQTRLLCAAG